ncbi:hypothetical protein R8Z50_11505 [Longispora sp. K20-0274]|uniref:CG0192-related protein n=1 Tax=Longispora sp. K20-0274 TaxID=3088255 RepID=UPI00399BAC1B
MALIHRATIQPTKLELLADWLTDRPWYQGAGEPTRIAGYRFDDPAGAVGIETILLRAGDGPVHQVPLTYRESPLAGAESVLIGTMEHSVLGTRWVYDGCADPVYAAALATAILTGAGQVAEFVDVDGRLEPRELSMAIHATGAGRPPVVEGIDAVTDADLTVITTSGLELTVVRRLDGEPGLTGATLSGTWAGQATPVVLAGASAH